MKKEEKMNFTKEAVRDFNGKIIAWEEFMANGDIVVRDFYGKILGKYDAFDDVTRDFYGKILAKGDAHGMLIGR